MLIVTSFDDFTSNKTSNNIFVRFQLSTLTKQQHKQNTW